MERSDLTALLSEDQMQKIFPTQRADQFFEAMFGDADEGAYDIHLKFKQKKDNKIHFEFHLKQRPGKCLACNLTYGLPEVFARHPIINIKGILRDLDQLLSGNGKCVDWEFGRTREISQALHIIPLTIHMD